ncbi:sphingomyelin phosphodiesterase [Streptomyces luteireticuli]|uniref:sphingomyelin phosphodiesterase n=1 Tax=Streptomyces luteireticuli TaxID=173858 RepID=UPI003558B062
MPDFSHVRAGADHGVGRFGCCEKGRRVKNLDTWKVISYNTMLSAPQPGERDFANDRRARLIGSARFLQDAGIIALQELIEPTSSLRLLTALARRGFTHQTPAVPHPVLSHSATAGRLTGDGTVNGGNAVVSRHPITLAEEHAYPAPRKSCAGLHQGFAYAAIHAQGSTLHVVSTHLQAGQDRACRDIRQYQLAHLARFLTEKEANGTLPPQDMVIIAGTLNTPYGSNEYAHMLDMLQAEPPTTKLGWPHSFDTTNNTIARRRHTRANATLRSPSQDLDHIVLRRGHTRPSRWNSRVLVSRIPWTANTCHYTDYSDHQPVLAGAAVTARPSLYDLTLTAIRITMHPGAPGYWPVPCGSITITTDTSGPHTVWERSPARAHSRRPGANILHHPLTFLAAGSFAIQTDITHRGAAGSPDNTLAYGTVWWQGGARLGRHCVPVQGSAGQATITFTTRLSSHQSLPALHPPALPSAPAPNAPCSRPDQPPNITEPQTPERP